MSGPTTIFSPAFAGRWKQILREDDEGEGVAAWQLVLVDAGLSVGEDPAGFFGAGTHNATMSWQRVRSLVSDGVVGPKTRSKIGMTPSALKQPSHLGAIPFVEAENWSRFATPRTRVDWIVIHSTEGAEASTKAERCADWFAGRNKRFPAPRASAHYCIDCDSIVQCVEEDRIAWHAPGANKLGIGLEHAGMARQTRIEWLDDFSEAMLKLSARLSAGICDRWGIPPNRVTAEGLVAGERGITTHCDVTEAFGKSTHTDPGPNFPMDLYLGWVARALG